MKKVKKILLGLSIPAAALAMSLSEPIDANAGPSGKCLTSKGDLCTYYSEICYDFKWKSNSEIDF